MMINSICIKKKAPANNGMGYSRSLNDANVHDNISRFSKDTIIFVHRFACVLKAKPERPPVIVLSTARTESEARENLTIAFDNKMRLIWAGRMPRNVREVQHD